MDVSEKQEAQLAQRPLCVIENFAKSKSLKVIRNDTVE